MNHLKDRLFLHLCTVSKINNSLLAKSFVCSIFLGLASFSTNAVTPGSYEECASIASSSERVKCYDSLAMKPKDDHKQSNVISKADAASLDLAKWADSESSADPRTTAFLKCFWSWIVNETYGSKTALNGDDFTKNMAAAIALFIERSETKRWSEFDKTTQKCLKRYPDLVRKLVKLTKSENNPLIKDMDELRADIESLDGRKVAIRGVGSYIMDIFMLKKSPLDMNPILIDTKNVNREQRLRIIRQCADIMNGCSITVHGVVGKTGYQNSIIADRIEW